MEKVGKWGKGFEQPLYDTAKTVGSVFQNPRSQFFQCGHNQRNHIRV